MTPEHKFQLLTTIIPVVPATLVSSWALIAQLRQTKPRLEIIASPIMARTVNDGEVMLNEWPGVVVRNLSPFSVWICNVGYTAEKKFYQFGRPLDSTFNEVKWPFEIVPRQRMAFYLDKHSFDGRKFVSAIPPDVKHDIWQVGLGYAITECGHTFFSKRISRKSLRTLPQSMRDATSVEGSQK